MEYQYYIYVDGCRKGPLPLDALLSEGLSENALVWREGLQEWVSAYDLPEVAVLLPPREIPRPDYPKYPPFGSNPYYDSNGRTTESSSDQRFRQSSPNPGYNDPYFYQRNNLRDNGRAIPHTDWLPWAIVATILGAIFSCIGLILGIFAISQANKANNAYAMGDNFVGDTANSSAKTLTIITFVIAGIGIITTGALFSTNFITNFL